MAKVQSRRCVSLNRGVYEDLKRYSKASGVPMSAFIEDLIRAAMARPGESAPAKVLHFAPRRTTPGQGTAKSAEGGAPAPAGPARPASGSVRYVGGVHQF
ncbi:MAG TPA: hypothetical protein VG389_03320 [Myxococcota bacterium]|jgi:hypothetical protein|nr:hypothetical protein [Myxococcota bacterium]